MCSVSFGLVYNCSSTDLSFSLSLSLEHPLFCCFFWYSHDWLNDKIEHKCGPDAVNQVEMSRDMALPLAYQRCPGNANNGLGCRVLVHFMVLYILFWCAVFVWSVLATVMWFQTRRQLLQLAAQKCPGDGLDNKLLPDNAQVELQPLKNGHK